MNMKKKLASLALITLALMVSVNAAWAQQTRLRARENKVINGLEAELRGDFRSNGSPIRLNAELENINLPVGTKVAFCLLQNGTKSLIGIGQVHLEAGRPTAEIELEANDGDRVPVVTAGDVLQARQKKAAPFSSNPGCGTALLISASFR
jgi:hypothetical protein